MSSVSGSFHLFQTDIFRVTRRVDAIYRANKSEQCLIGEREKFHWLNFSPSSAPSTDRFGRQTELQRRERRWRRNKKNSSIEIRQSAPSSDTKFTSPLISLDFTLIRVSAPSVNVSNQFSFFGSIFQEKCVCCNWPWSAPSTPQFIHLLGGRREDEYLVCAGAT